MGLLNNHLGFRINFYSFLITLLLVVMFTAINIFVTIDEHTAVIDNITEEIRVRDIPNITSALWELSPERIEQSLSSLMNLQYVVWVQVEDGKIVYEMGNDSERNHVVDFALTKDTQGEFGTLHVAFDMVNMKRETYIVNRNQLLSIIASLIILSSSLLVLYNFQVTRKLRALIGQLNIVDLESLNIPFTLPGKQGNDEISQLIRGMETMRSNLLRETEEKRLVEKRLQEREKDNIAILNGIGEAIFIHDRETGTILDVNEQAVLLFRAQREKLIHITPDEISSGKAPYTGEKSMAHLRQAGRTGQDLFIWRSRRFDGSLFWSEVFLKRSRFRDKDCIFATVRDITERKKAEDSVSQYQKMDSIGQLAGGIAHDFNNMLGGIMGAVELLKSELDPDSSSMNYVDMILKASERSADLTAKLLTFSRRKPVDMKPIDGREVIMDTLEIISRSIDKQIELITDFKAENRTVEADYTSLQNALINLCINGRDAIGGSGSLTVSTANLVLAKEDCSLSPFELVPGLYWEISIKDTGCGMDGSVLQHLFEPFFTTKDVGKGTGMGLASVYGMVTKHRGAISVYSELGKGSQFNLILPVIGAIPQSKRTGDLFKSPPTGTGRILLIDDEEIIRNSMQIMLEKLGYTVSTAVNGAEGLRIFDELKTDIDLVLLDMIMPGMGGRETLEELIKRDKDVKVILCSGFSSETDSLNGKVFGHLHKPVSYLELAATVSNTLRGAGTSR